MTPPWLWACGPVAPPWVTCVQPLQKCLINVVQVYVQLEFEGEKCCVENRDINRLPSGGHVVTCDLRFISEAEFSSSDPTTRQNRGGALPRLLWQER